MHRAARPSQLDHGTALLQKKSLGEVFKGAHAYVLNEGLLGGQGWGRGTPSPGGWEGSHAGTGAEPGGELVRNTILTSRQTWATGPSRGSCLEGHSQCKSLACSGCPELATYIFIRLSFCVVYLAHPPHSISAPQLLFAFQNPVPCRLPSGFSGSAPPGCFFISFVNFGPTAYPCCNLLIALWTSQSCPQRLYAVTAPNVHSMTGK